MLSEMVLKIILDKVIKGSAKYLREKKIKVDSSARDLEQAISNHISQVSIWSGEITFKDLARSKLISQVFIDLEILLMPRKIRIDEDENVKKISSKAIFRQIDRHIVILGQPGAGKTTVVKFICQSILTDEQYYPDLFKLPLLIRLRDFNIRLSGRADKNPLINALLETLGLVINSDAKDIKEEDLLLAKQRILVPILDDLKSAIILDGYDEISDRKNKDRVIEDFKWLSLSCTACRLILTSRSSDYNYSFENISVLEICPLNASQIESFAQKWLGDDIIANKFLIELKKSPFLDTAIRPLTIGHLCAIYERSGRIPDKPKTVYRKIINLLLEEWDEQRGVRRVSHYGTFEIDRKFEFLCRLSYELTIEYRRTTFSDQNLNKIYHKMCGDFNLAPIESKSVISEIEGHTGLILEAGYHKYEFAHKSLQEFMCAEHLVKLPTIPDFELLASLPNELAIAVTISSNPSRYFTELVLNHFLPKQMGELFIINFINRLLLEKPDFNASKELNLALIVLFTLFKTVESKQLRLFDFDLPKQFDLFVELIFAKNKKFSASPYYALMEEVNTVAGDKVLRLKRRTEAKPFGSYQLPEFVYVRSSFIDDFNLINTLDL